MRNPIRRGLNLAKRIGRRLRSRTPVLAPGAVPSPSPLSRDPEYDAWLQQNRLTGERLREAEARALAWQSRPLISVVIPVHNTDPRHLESTLSSVENQLYDNWEICIADDASRDQRSLKFLESYG